MCAASARSRGVASPVIRVEKKRQPFSDDVGGSKDVPHVCRWGTRRDFRFP